MKDQQPAESDQESLMKRAQEQLTAQELEEIQKQGQPLTESLIEAIIQRRSQ